MDVIELFISNIEDIQTQEPSLTITVKSNPCLYVNKKYILCFMQTSFFHRAFKHMSWYAKKQQQIKAKSELLQLLNEISRIDIKQ